MPRTDGRETRERGGRGQGTAQSFDAIALLESQHRLVEEVFQRLAEGSGRDLRAPLVELADLLTTHSAIEERHFYPGVRSDETESLIDDSYEDHLEVKRLLLHLLDVGPEDDDFAAKVEELQGLVEAHVAEEENDLFPRVRDLIDPEQLMGLAQEMTATMVEMREQGPPHEHLEAEVNAAEH